MQPRDHSPAVLLGRCVARRDDDRSTSARRVSVVLFWHLLSGRALLLLMLLLLLLLMLRCLSIEPDCDTVHPVSRFRAHSAIIARSAKNRRLLPRPGNTPKRIRAPRLCRAASSSERPLGVSETLPKSETTESPLK